MTGSQGHKYFFIRKAADLIAKLSNTWFIYGLTPKRISLFKI